ncbi:hypothetical protein J8281_15030 [Aquimarina sp. U1-2]|uniref:hypothetical protein n=1 Tax=Aquimarina sp. U1-2 TaxID=2823141 RepID=UPI001AECE64B|nr:hypothetical protein [Aquimarina sp. U1-2]MBP2833507.1 hypothetical protein [Aquimarina sp. U1-2]
MRNIILFLFIVYSTLVFGQEPHTEIRNEIYETYEDGSIKEERIYNGKQWIKSIEYDEKGQIKAVSRIDNEISQEYVRYYNYNANQVEQHVLAYSNGKPDINIFYDQKGIPTMIFFLNKEEGRRFEVFYKRGKLNVINFFNNFGKLIKKMSFYSTGELENVGYFLQGKPHGVLKKFLKDGSLLEEKFYSRGLLEGQGNLKIYDGWEEEIAEFDSIPFLQKELRKKLEKITPILMNSSKTVEHE